MVAREERSCLEEYELDWVIVIEIDIVKKLLKRIERNVWLRRNNNE